MKRFFLFFLILLLITLSGLVFSFWLGFNIPQTQAFETEDPDPLPPVSLPNVSSAPRETHYVLDCIDCEGGGIPIPLPVVGWDAGSAPVRVVSNPDDDGGVFVWGGNRGLKDGVRIYNYEDDAAWTRCIPAEAQCAYFMVLAEQERNKVAEFKLYEEKYIQAMFNQFSNTCPTFAKMAGIALIVDPNDPVGSVPEVKVAENIVDSSCKNIITNWETALIDKNRAVKMALSEYFEDLDLPFLDAIAKKSLIQQVNGDGAYQEFPEAVRIQSFLVDAIGGSYVEANTSLLGFVRRMTRPMSKASLALTVNSYVQGEQKRAGDALLEDARLGGGLLSKYEVTSTIQTSSGKKYPSKVIATLPSSIGFDDLSKVRTAAIDALANTTDYTSDVANQLNPDLNSGDGLWYGGASQLRDLLNTTMAGGPGIFRIGNPAPALPPEAQNPSSCSIVFSDASLTMGLNEQRQYSFSVRVQLGVGLPGSVDDIENIKVSFQDSNIARAVPDVLGPQNATSGNVFITTINSLKAGDTDMDIKATLKSSAGGADCGIAAGLEVLPFARYACNSQRCQSPTINPDPDNTVYACVGTPDDGLNNDCTSLGSNCRQEWCVDVGDKNKDGFNALCYDSCSADYQATCQRAGYICNATSTSGLLPPKKISTSPGIKFLSALIKNNLKF